MVGAGRQVLTAILMQSRETSTVMVPEISAKSAEG